ncbi:MAG: hypothetical protein JNN12_01335 [Bacteroidetes Order II. Incertae sedis bacterium]|nr:hypothetical protein [Bacteroidetes Order II. bacterium]
MSQDLNLDGMVDWNGEFEQVLATTFHQSANPGTVDYIAYEQLPGGVWELELMAMLGYPLNPSLSDLKNLYSEISSKTSQLTLNTPTGTFSGAPTRGDQLRLKTSLSLKGNKPTPEYYRDWRLNYK